MPIKAAGGIGKETALAFAEAGARGVVFADINDIGAKESAEESKKSATHAEYRTLAVKVDMNDAESVQSLVTTVVGEFGRIDYAVNSAGVSIVFEFLPLYPSKITNDVIKIDLETYGSFTSALDLDVFSQMSNTNISGAVRFVRAVMAAMAQQEPLTFPGTGRRASRSLGRGSIVLLGSTSSLVGVPGMVSYTTTKHAIIGLVKSAGKSWLDYTILCSNES